MQCRCDISGKWCWKCLHLFLFTLTIALCQVLFHTDLRFNFFFFILSLKEKYLYFHIFFLVWVYIVPLMNISLISRRNHYWWSSENVELCSAFMPIKQWWFFSLSQLLCHRTSIYNCHLRAPMKLTPCLKLQVSLLFTQLINCTVAAVYFQLKQMIYTNKRNFHCSILFELFQ